MPLPKYYCDYCEKAFNDTPSMRKKHFESKFHKMQVKMHYDSFRGTNYLKNPVRVTKPPCHNLLKNGYCEYGANCKYSHVFGNINFTAPPIGMYDLPPSMVRPPLEGYSLSEVNKAQWGWQNEPND